MSVSTGASAGRVGAPGDPPTPGEAPTGRIARVAAGLAQDAADAALIERLHRAQVRPVLLKGPVTGRRLYHGEHRARADCDLLVPTGALAAAQEVLLAAGYRACDPGPHAQLFLHPGGHQVDLHWTLSRATLGADRLWAVLAGHTVPFALGGTVVAALDPAAHACHLLIHAVSGAGPSLAARRDLDRAVGTLSLPVWLGALTVADELGARAAIVAALRTGSPACWRLADDLGLPARVPFGQRLWLADRSLLVRARGLLAAATPAQRRTLLRRWLLPTRAEIMSWSARGDVRAVTPAALPPAGRLLWFRARQLALFSLAFRRAARHGGEHGPT